MAKKKNKKDKKDASPSDPVESLRAAIERTFHATTEGAAGTQKRSRQLVDEVTHAAARIRATIEELRVLDEVKGLRNDIEALGRRIAALEARDGSSTASRPRATRSASSRSTGATTRSRSTGTARAKATGTTRAKPAGTARAKPAAARKPRTTRSSSGGGSSRSSSGTGSSRSPGGSSS
jgi:hypothetical protein